MTTDIEQIAPELKERMNKWMAQQRMFEGTVLPFHIEPYKLAAILAALKEAQERADKAESRLEDEVNDFGDKSALRAERDAAITERDEARAQGQEASLAYMEKRKEIANLEHERDALAAERDEAREMLEEAEAIISERHDRMRLVDRIADLIGLPHDQELDTTGFELWLDGQAARCDALTVALKGAGAQMRAIAKIQREMWEIDFGCSGQNTRQIEDYFNRRAKDALDATCAALAQIKAVLGETG